MGNHIMDNLPLLERDKALALYAACKRIKEASACRGLKMRAIDEAAALCGISAVSMRRWYEAWRAAGEDPLSLVDRRYRKQQAHAAQIFGRLARALYPVPAQGGSAYRPPPAPPGLEPAAQDHPRL